MTSMEMINFSSNEPYGYTSLMRDEPDGPFNLLKTRVTQFFDRTPKPAVPEERSRIETAEVAFDAVEVTTEWGELSTTFEHLSESVLEYLQDLNVPLQLIISAREAKEIALGILGKNADEKIPPSKMAVLFFSIVNRISKALAGLQNFGIVAPAVIGFLRISLIGSICLLAGTGISLGDNILRYTSFAKLLVAGLKFAAAAIALFLIFHVSAPLHILSLMLVSGTIILSVKTGSD